MSYVHFRFFQIVPLKELKLEYQPFEAKRNLSNLSDVFLADARIIRLLPKLLGKNFYGRNRYALFPSALEFIFSVLFFSCFNLILALNSFLIFVILSSEFLFKLT